MSVWMDPIVVQALSLRYSIAGLSEQAKIIQDQFVLNAANVIKGENVAKGVDVSQRFGGSYAIAGTTYYLGFNNSMHRTEILTF
jgi:hypothetical protein